MLASEAEAPAAAEAQAAEVAAAEAAAAEAKLFVQLQRLFEHQGVEL